MNKLDENVREPIKMTQPGTNAQPEPWLRGTLTEVPAVQRAVLHALELAREDLERWCEGLSDPELNARPGGIPPVAFHLRHITRSADRLLTYAEGGQLSPDQIAAMKTELDPGATRNELLAEACSRLQQERASHSCLFRRAFTGRTTRRQKATAEQRWWAAGAHCRPYPAPRWPGNYHGQDHPRAAPSI